MVACYAIRRLTNTAVVDLVTSTEEVKSMKYGDSKGKWMLFPVVADT